MTDIARWNGMDQLSEKFHVASPYAYVMNNPVSFFDPDGRDIKPISGGWQFDGNDINLVFSYFSNGGNYGNLTSQLDGYGNFGKGAISSFWNSFNSGGVMGSVNVNKGYLSWSTDGYLGKTGANGMPIQEIVFHRAKIEQGGFVNWDKVNKGIGQLDLLTN